MIGSYISYMSAEHCLAKVRIKKRKLRQVKRFYLLLSTLMNELFEYAPKSGHVKMPYNVSFGLIHDKRDSILLKGTDQKTGKTMYLYNIRVIGQIFEERREQMLNDNTTNTLFSWIGDVCSLYIRPFVYEYVVTQGTRSSRKNYKTNC